METKRKQVLSAIQPTGKLHFGRYFGAIQNWVRLQDQFACTYGVVDYHAMTMPFNPKKLREQTWNVVFDLIAAGVHPDNLFIQSLVPEHAELCWIFNCYTSFGQLSRMTQFKDKSKQSTETAEDAFISAGLLDYPVLQAADILIYRADYVPVGKDQEQHLELSRNIAQRFNAQVGREYFVLPEPLWAEVPKVMSTADPTRKMSASLGEKHHIDLFADEARIRKQIASAVTDIGPATPGVMSPGVENLFSLLRAAGDTASFDVLLEHHRSGQLKYVDLKEAVANALVAISQPARERRAAILADKKAVKEHVKASSARIREKARQTVAEVKDLCGLMNL
jgi:tryptophanyl-tRNA synthetase